MKLLINTSTLKGTGVTQVATSFIYECINFPENQYYIFLSPKVSSSINRSEFPSNFIFYEFGKRQLYGVNGWKELNQMKQIERDIRPDIVFSVFGPSIWTPSSPHLMGYAYPHYVYPDSPYFKIISIKEKAIILVKKMVHIALLKNNGRYYVCETEDVSNRLSKYFNIDRQNIFTVYNTASAIFLKYKMSKDKSILNNEAKEFRFYSLCSPYRHKNLQILNEVVPLLKNMRLNRDVKFYVTIPNSDYINIFNEDIRKDVINVGPLSINQCPGFVSECDALFLPTLLECYSANYPEAMALQKPILTSNLPFAKTVCGDAALYFDPLEPESIVNCIVKIVNNIMLYKEFQNKGRNRLLYFGGPELRAKKYLEICQKILQNNT